MVRRILIKGSSGAGKSTLAAELARRFGFVHVELDALYHGPNWTPASAAQFRTHLTALLDDDRGWVVDGNFDQELGDLLLDRVDLVVWLDLPLATKMVRLARRSVSRWISGDELWNGNRETLRGMLGGPNSLFPWALRMHFRHRRQWPENLAGRPLARLRSDAEVRAWLAGL
jgi:hypothetical protein